MNQYGRPSRKRRFSFKRPQETVLWRRELPQGAYRRAGRFKRKVSLPGGPSVLVRSPGALITVPRGAINKSLRVLDPEPGELRFPNPPGQGGGRGAIAAPRRTSPLRRDPSGGDPPGNSPDRHWIRLIALIVSE